MLQDVAKQCRPVKDALDLVHDLVKLFRNSPKRSSLLGKCAADLSQSLNDDIDNESDNYPPETASTANVSPSATSNASPVHKQSTLKPLCPTRWTVRTSAIDAVLKNFEVLQVALDELRSDRSTDREHASVASGLAAILDNFSVFGMHLSRKIFSVSEQLSRTLQTKDISMSDALKAVDITLSSFKNQRSDAVFDEFYDSIVVLSAGKTSDAQAPKVRKAKKLFDATNSAAAHVYAAPKDYFRHKYYEAVDVVIGELERRFDRSSSSQVVVMEIEHLLLDAANGKQIDEIPTYVKTLYKTDLDKPRLHAQLGMLRDVIRVSQLCSDRTITISSIISVMSQASDTVQQMFDQVTTMVKLYLSISVTTATAERTFCAASS